MGGSGYSEPRNSMTTNRKPWEGYPLPMTLPYQGSLDPFEDISEFLDKLQVPYVLMVGTPDSDTTNTWSNIADYGPPGLEIMADSFAAMANDIINDNDNE